MSLKLRQPRTELWLLRLPNFQTWLSTPDGKLWLSGIPGAGKTVLAGTIIEASLEKCNDSVAGAFFFCDYKAEQTHSPANILAALAYQIAIQKKEAYQTLEQYYHDLHPKGSLSRDYTIGGLEKALRDMIKLFDRVFITVDGIDECGQNVEEVLDVLCAISEDSDSISMALLSRDEHNIRDRLKDDFVCEQVAAHTEDITEYVTAQIEERTRIRKLRIDDPKLKGEIMQSLVKGAKGMFRWVACQLDQLEQCDSDQECQDALKKLPPNLNETYLRILERIPTNKMRLAQLILHFIAFAYPPLTIQQLREAVSIPETGGFLNPSSLIRESGIQKLCSSLVRKSNVGKHFEFAHFSVQEFLQNETILQDRFSQLVISESRCNRLMAIQCLKYLQLENFNHIPAATMDELSYMDESKKNNQFYEYAACRWLLFALDEWTDEEVIQSAKKLFSREKTAFFSSWIAQFIVAHIHKANEDKVMDSVTKINHRCFTPFHVACALSLPIICSHLLEEGANVHQESPIGTPIQCATGSLKALGKCFDIRSIRGYYMESIADTLAPETIRCLLKAGVDHFSIASNFGQNERPLQLAIDALATTENFSVVNLLISEEFLLDEVDIKELLSLMEDWVSDRIRISMKTLEMTLKQFVITLNSMIDSSPLHRELCSVAWKFAIKLNLRFTSDPYLVDLSISLSPDAQKQHLIQAVMDGDVAIFERTRKDSGLNPSEVLDDNGCSLIYLALCHYKHRSMIETLLEAGCSFFQPARDGTLQVHEWLCSIVLPNEESCIKSLVEVLINHGVTVCSQDKFGRNILHLSCDEPRRLSAFLKYDDEANVACALRMVDRDGYTPLTMAMKRGFTPSASLLFEKCKGDREVWQSPIPILLLAVRKNYEDIFRNIFDSGTIPTEFAGNTLTPLHYVGAKTSPGFIEYLKSKYPNACDVRIDGKIPLIVYLEELFRRPSRGKRLNTGVISALYPIKSPDNEMKLWEYFVKDMIPNIRSTSRAVQSEISDSDIDDDDTDDYDIDYDDAVILRAIEELVHLGCLDSYEAISQRSALSIILEGSGNNFRDLHDIWPITSQTICDIINRTSQWSEIRVSPLLIRLFKAATTSNSHELVSLLCQKGVNVHERVEDCSALEVACQADVKDEIFELLLDHAEKERLDETNPADEGRGLIHRLAVPGSTRKIVELLRRGANPDLRTRIYPNSPALVYHLDQGQIESSVILLNNGADPTHTDANEFDAHAAAAWNGATTFLVALRQTVTSKWHLDYQKRYEYSVPISEKEDIDIHVTGCNALHLAAVSGNVDCLSFYIDHGIISDINTTTDSKFTPLHCAALEGHTDTIKFLNRQGANINARTSLDNLPLHFAVMNGHLNATQILISLNSDNTMNKSGMSPYMLTYHLNNQPLVEVFHGSGRKHVSHHNNPTGEDTMAVSTKQKLGLAVALEGAIKNGNSQLCEILRQKGCQLDDDVPSCNGCSPLLLAIRHKKMDIVKWLLTHKASTLKISCQSHDFLCPIDEILKDKDLAPIMPQFLERYLSDGGSLLMESNDLVCAAVSLGNTEGLRILLEHAQQNARHYADIAGVKWTQGIPMLVNRYEGNYSPLHRATFCGNIEIVEYLLKNGANLNALDENSRTPLHVAMESNADGIQEVTRALIRYGAELDCRDWRGDTPLMCASYRGRLDLVELLLNAGANPYGCNFHLESTLHRSAAGSFGKETASGHKRIFVKLSALGLDVHAKDDRCSSAIHMTMWIDHFAALILNGNFEIQKTAPFPWNLFGARADISWLTTAFTMFRRKIPRDTLRTIANTEPRIGWTPLCMYAVIGLPRTMDNLLALGANIEFEGCPDGTALMAACCAGRLDSVIFLVRRGAALSYHGPNGFRTTVDENKTPKRILEWLLVTRFTDQAKIEKSPDDDRSAEPVVLRSWGGLAKAGLVISGDLERRPNESSLAYWISLMGKKKKFRGEVVPIADGRRTVRPSKLVPFEPVRIHPDGYEIPKAIDSSGV